MTSTLLVVGQIGLLIVAGLAYRYLQGLPERFHQEGVKRFEFSLNAQLEEVRAALAQELELLKISQQELQVHKTDEFIRLVEFFIGFMTDKEKVRRLETSPKDAQQLNKNMVELGVKLFFFASDETVKAYLEWRMFGLGQQMANSDPMRNIVLLAQLMVMMRRDPRLPSN
jgi:hypothetical protein